jgi:alpha-L-arabinofuranosidase
MAGRFGLTWAVAAALAWVAAPAQAEIRASASIDARAEGVRIAPEIYGQFAEHLGTGIEDGIWVGEDSPIPNIRGFRRDVVEALRRLKVPVVRWPGGCFADIYRWRDGIGPRDRRPVTLNKWWGNAEERNRFGTHEFFDFAGLIGAKTYLNVNVGTGTAGEAREWLEYVTSPSGSTLAQLRRAHGRERPWRVEYIGIGNEMWGCGGNLTAAEFAPLARRFATFLREEGGPRIIAGGATGDDHGWTEALVRDPRGFDAVSLHQYTLPTGDWTTKGAAVGFDEAAWAQTFQRTRRMEELIVGHDAVMDRHDAENRLALIVAEWGSWYDPTPGTNSAFLQQENSLRDALIAALNFAIFHRHADRVRMANIAQMVNVLQAVIHTRGERMVLTPTYHAFEMFTPFQGAQALPAQVTSPDYVVGDVSQPAVEVTAARDAAGAVHVALVNVDPDEEAIVSLALAGRGQGALSGRLLTAERMDSVNSFGAPETVRPVPFNGARWLGERLEVRLPAKSVVVLRVG